MPGGLEIPPGGSFAALLRIPRAADLQFETAPEARELFALKIETDSGGIPSAVESSGKGKWTVDLKGIAGEITRITLTNRSHRPLHWTAARVIGREVSERIFDRSSESRPAPNVLLYVIDTLRADQMSSYGSRVRTSPHLERFAAGGTIFERAWSMSSKTVPSVPALLTSRFPHQNPDLRRPELTPWTLAGEFQKAGYRTGLFEANPWSGPQAFARGFDTFEVLRLEPQSVDHVFATAIHEAALTWLDNIGREPFFLMLQTMDVHDPYGVPEGFPLTLPVSPTPEAIRKPRPTSEKTRKHQELMALVAGGPLEEAPHLRSSLYRESIRFADSELNVFLGELAERGLLSNLLVVVTADHGEALGREDDGTFLHGHDLHEELIHVPLIIVGPGVTPGRRVTSNVSQIDLAPTLLDFAGLQIPADARGTSLFKPRTPSCGAEVLAERTGPLVEPGELPRPEEVAEFAVRSGRWKLIEGPEESELFDLASDPFETRNVVEAHPVTAAFLRNVYDHHTASSPENILLEPTRTPSPQQKQRENEALRALGYIE